MHPICTCIIHFVPLSFFPYLLLLSSLTFSSFQLVCIYAASLQYTTCVNEAKDPTVRSPSSFH